MYGAENDLEALDERLRPDRQKSNAVEEGLRQQPRPRGPEDEIGLGL